MNRTLPFLVLFLMALVGRAQTHFYLDQIVVSPSNPTTLDEVEIQLVGNLSDGGAYIATALADVSGSQVNITLVAMSNGGITVLVPHTETIALGQLPAGTYTIDFTDASTGILDSAPPAQHTFTVSGPEFPCEELTVDVRWAPFSDTAVVVHVQNTSAELFNYPNFILYDAEGNILAVETVTFFGIPQDSWHTLRLVDDATLPVGTFNGRLELWTDFTSTLACTWEQPFELCPPVGCHTIYPTLANFGGAIPIGTFNWSIADDGGEVASGQFELTSEIQQDADTVCLPAGAYFMDVSPLSPPTGGAPTFFVAGPGLLSTDTRPVLWSLPVQLEFPLYPYCIESPEGLHEVEGKGLRAATVPGGLWVSSTDGRALGAVRLLDAQGRVVQSTTATTDRHYLPVGTPGMYVLHAGDHTLKVAAGLD